MEWDTGLTDQDAFARRVRRYASDDDRAGSRGSASLSPELGIRPPVAAGARGATAVPTRVPNALGWTTSRRSRTGSRGYTGAIGAPSRSPRRSACVVERARWCGDGSRFVLRSPSSDIGPPRGCGVGSWVDGCVRSLEERRVHALANWRHPTSTLGWRRHPRWRRHLVPLSLAWDGECIILATDEDTVTARTSSRRDGPTRCRRTRDVVMIDAELEAVVAIG